MKRIFVGLIMTLLSLSMSSEIVSFVKRDCANDVELTEPSLVDYEEKNDGKQNPDDGIRVKEDVIILDEDKIYWNDVIADYIAEQQAIDENFTYFLDGNGNKNNPYRIKSAMDFAYLSYVTNIENATFLTNSYISLENDIYLNDGYFEEDGTYHDGGDGNLYEWKQIKQANNTSLIGNGHTIYGVYVNSNFARGTIFGGWNTTNRIEGVNISNAYVNCSNTSNDTAPSMFAFTVNYISDCKITKSFFKSKVGFAGFVRTLIKSAKNCANYADIDANNFAFGICHNLKKTAVVQYCYNYGNLKANGVAGGIAGTLVASGEIGVISNCINYGNVISNNNHSAGMSCCARIVENCVNYGKISGAGNAGGIAICVQGNDIEISNCQNFGQVSGSNAGGVLGYGCNATLTNCKNYGKISSGALIGYISNSENAKVLINECYAEGGTLAVGRVYMASTNVKCEILISNCNFKFDQKLNDVSSLLIGSMSGGERVVQAVNVQIDAGNLDLPIIKDSCEAKLKNILIKTNGDYTSFIKNVNNPKINSVIVAKNNKPILFYGTTFNGFYTKWKTGDIGLTALQQNGGYQSVITKDWLENVCGAREIVL